MNLLDILNSKPTVPADVSEDVIRDRQLCSLLPAPGELGPGGMPGPR